MWASLGVVSTAGYSGTPLVKKLGIKPGATLGLIGAPKGFDRTLGELPDDVAVLRRLQRPLDVIVAFYVERSALERRLPALRAALATRRAACGSRGRSARREWRRT